MTEVAVLEEASVREVDVNGGVGGLLVFLVMVEDGLGCVSARGGGIKAGRHEGASKRCEEGDAWRRTFGRVLVFGCVG